LGSAQQVMAGGGQGLDKLNAATDGLDWDALAAENPELKPMAEDIRTNGPSAALKCAAGLCDAMRDRRISHYCAVGTCRIRACRAF
jgi:hypothetical protein